MVDYQDNECAASNRMTKPDPDTSNLFSEHGQGTSILIGEDITTMCQNQRLIVDGFDPGSLQGTSYDFRIGAKAVVGGSPTWSIVSQFDFFPNWVAEPKSEIFEIVFPKIKMLDGLIS